MVVVVVAAAVVAATAGRVNGDGILYMWVRRSGGTTGRGVGCCRPTHDQIVLIFFFGFPRNSVKCVKWGTAV